MRQVDSGSPPLSPDDVVRFAASHRPALADGDYELTLKHSVPALRIDAVRLFDFSIAGPRFALAPGDVSSQFPPKGAAGDFERVLPHVILSRASLPWERLATADRVDDAPSWLALLVFADDEIAGLATTVDAAALISAAVDRPPQPLADGDRFATLVRGSTDDAGQAVLVLDLPATLAETVLPAAADLPFLVSVREVEGRPARAVVMAHRLPVPGRRNHVHLVSIEHHYRPGPAAVHSLPWPATHRHWSELVANVDTVRLISLARWDFFCDNSSGDLQAILDALSPSALAMPIDRLTSSKEMVYGGRVPLEHRRAGGETTAAWYGGPLRTRFRGRAAALPVRHAAELVLVDNATGMADISHAAAWELGRLLALRDGSVSVPLNQWKRQVAHAGHAAEHSALAAELGHAPLVCPMLPADLDAWFGVALGLLAAVPFDYMVPDPDLLKPESICWLVLDQDWLAALFDGAFSIGRSSRRQLHDDQRLRTALPKIGARSGLLLRSRAVTGWPDLLVDGFDESTGQPSRSLRCERIGRDTLLVLFEGFVGRVDIHLHPQALHFGFDGSFASGFTKTDRGGAVRPLVYRDRPARVVDIAGFASQSLAATGSHDFSMQMIEPAPRVSHAFRLSHG